MRRWSLKNTADVSLHTQTSLARRSSLKQLLTSCVSSPHHHRNLLNWLCWLWGWLCEHFLMVLLSHGPRTYFVKRSYYIAVLSQAVSGAESRGFHRAPLFFRINLCSTNRKIRDLNSGPVRIPGHAVRMLTGKKGSAALSWLKRCDLKSSLGQGTWLTGCSAAPAVKVCPPFGLSWIKGVFVQQAKLWIAHIS